MSRAPLRLALGWLLLSGFDLVRDPDSPQPIVWGSTTLTMVIQQDGSDDISDGSDLAAIRAALQTWNQVGCSAFRFVDGGTSASRAVGDDGVNRITFVESNWPGAANGALALTDRRRDTGSSPQRWREADVLLNGQDFRWATGGDVQRRDVQQSVVHELGHVLGLQHAASPQAAMYFAGGAGSTVGRVLSADDLAGACYLYPQGAFTCSGDAQCPLLHGFYGGENLRLACSGGTCTTGQGGYGADCFDGAHCASGTCLADPAGAASIDPGFCSQSCTGPGTCPGGDYCDQSTGAGRCYLGHDDCIADQDCGGVNRYCVRDLDGRYRCLRTCLRDQNCAQVPGAVCHGGTGAAPPGFCRTPGPKVAGDRCAHGLECASLACTAGGASPTCTGGAPSIDAGLPATDGGAPATDGGAQVDAAAPADLGLNTGRDAVAGAPDAGDAALEADAAEGSSPSGGCACSAGGELTRGGWGWLLLLLSGGSATRRRRSTGRA